MQHGTKVYQDGSALSPNVSGLTHTVTGLTAGTEYSFTVSAVNSIGEGPQSEAVTAAPTAAESAPAAAPQGLTAAAGVEQVTLSWNAVSDASEYKVYQDGSALSPNVSGLTHTVTGLTAGTEYSFTVSAVNSVGEGPQSAEVTATPTVRITIPAAAPQGLSGSSGRRAGNTELECGKWCDIVQGVSE